MDDMREQFEAWCRVDGRFGLHCVNGAYSAVNTHNAWIGWQAAQPSAGRIADAYELGAKGAPATEVERLRFEAWMRGHCWALSATWNGKEYVSDLEQGGAFCPHAMRTRMLWAAWRDRAALNTAQAVDLRDREADRQRFRDPKFNAYLDQAITENGEFTTWHQITNTYDAYCGYEAGLHDGAPGPFDTQVVDLGQFRGLVAHLIDQCGDDLTAEQFLLAGRLLNTIDAQA